ncbi:Hypp9130 [Branchiostoma lanceolatum]|uniref:Hypp9130 protein n=1 Tax=Branchiostoma lanceolatum TaxID=7740 RepID=A0A8J9ZDM0_BRALA|nr:Hypp9130 [Branchiostoma lanceolatum]
MGDKLSKQIYDENAVDPAAAAASELAKLMVNGAVDPASVSEPKAKGETDSEESPKTVAKLSKSRQRKGPVVGGLGQVIFGELWELIFPAASLSPTLEDIRCLVQQELKEDVLDQINGVLHDLQDALSINYAVNKRNSDITNPADRQRLHDYLQVALENVVLDQINGVLHDLQDALSINYAVNKRNSDITNPADRQRLHDYLQGLDQNLTTTGVIGTLMQENYAKIGLSCFLLLAGLRIALYQEMAVVDPENKSPDLNPALSPRYATPHTGVVAMYAREYAQHVEQWWPQVIDDRENAIVFYESYMLSPGLVALNTFAKKNCMFSVPCVVLYVCG